MIKEAVWFSTKIWIIDVTFVAISVLKKKSIPVTTSAAKFCCNRDISSFIKLNGKMFQYVSISM